MPPDDSGRTARDLLLHSWPGRLFIIAAVLKVLVALIRLVGDVPSFLRVLSTAATVALAFSVLFFLTRLIFSCSGGCSGASAGSSSCRTSSSASCRRS